MSAFDSLKSLFSKKPSVNTANTAAPPQEGLYSVASDECIGCRSCQKVCPQGCIDFSSVSARILPEHCVNCGKCFEVCPAGAIQKSGSSSL